MEHSEGFILTGQGAAYLDATGPRSGCAAWVGAEAQADWRARQIVRRIRRNKLERDPRRTVPPAA